MVDFIAYRNAIMGNIIVHQAVCDQYICIVAPFSEFYP